MLKKLSMRKRSLESRKSKKKCNKKLLRRPMTFVIQPVACSNKWKKTRRNKSKKREIDMLVRMPRSRSRLTKKELLSLKRSKMPLISKSAKRKKLKKRLKEKRRRPRIK